MSTRAYVFEKVADNNYRGIYVHFDGYPEGAGRTLVDNYKTPEKVSELIDLGSLSVLGNTIGKKIEFNSYGNNENDYNQCLAYHRDRGEKLEIMHETNLDVNKMSYWISYVYLYDHCTKTWYIWVNDEWKDLASELI